MKTPEDQIKTLRYLQENAADVVKKYFNIQKMEVLKVRSGTLYLKTILLVSLSLDLCS